MKALAIIPKSVPEARQALKIMLRDLRKAKTYKEIYKIERIAEGLKALFKHVDDVRLEAGKVIVLAGHRIGLELIKQPLAKGAQGNPGGRGAKIVRSHDVTAHSATLAELAGYKMRAHRLKKLAGYLEDETEALINGLIEQRVDNITIGAVLKAFAAIERQARRDEIPIDLPPLSERCKLLCTSVADLPSKLEPASIDWIITDPPYEESAIPLYGELAKTAAVVLKPGGSCLVMTGQSFLPQVISALATKLRYHWTGAYLTPGGQAAQIWPRKVNTFWKPLLWYTNGAFAGQRWYGDVVSSSVNDNDKNHHEWGQSESGMMDLVSKFTNIGDVVLDPFLGGGTTGIVALASDRLFIGADIDASIIDQAEIRLRRVM